MVGDGSHQPGRRTLIAAIVFALLSAAALMGAHRVLDAERSALGRSFAVRGFVELQVRVKDGRLVPVGSQELRGFDAVYRARVGRANLPPWQVVARPVPLFGWLWESLPPDDEAVGTQSLALEVLGATLPEDFESQLSAQVSRAFDGVFPESFSAWSGGFDETTERAFWLELATPVRVSRQQTSAEFEVEGLGRTTPGWVLPTVSVLTGAGLVLGLIALALFVRWAIQAWRRRRWRRSPTACAACGYEMVGLEVCPECGRRD